MNKRGFLATDLRELPAYGLSEASHYLRIPRATLRSWVVGRFYLIEGGRRPFKPIIVLPQEDPPMPSFMNLVEAHVPDAIRREHEIPPPKVSSALDYLKRRFPSKHPLPDQTFEFDGLPRLVVL